MSETLQVRRGRFAGGIGVRSEQSVVDENFDLLPIELQFAFKPLIRFKTLACSEGGASRLPQTILIGAVKRRFAIVAEA